MYSILFYTYCTSANNYTDLKLTVLYLQTVN